MLCAVCGDELGNTYQLLSQFMMVYKRKFSRKTSRRTRRPKKKFSGAPKKVPRAIKNYVDSKIKKNVNHQMFPSQIDYNVLNVFNEFQFGRDISKGTNKFNRIGDKILLTGLRVEYEIQHTNPLGVQTAPIYFKMYLVQSRQTFSTSSYWFRNNTDNDVLSFATQATNRPAGLLTAKLNTRDIKIHGSKTMRVVPRNTNLTGSYGRYGKTYFKMKTPTTVSFDNPGDTTPYPVNDIHPNISFVFLPIYADFIAGETEPTFNAKITLKWYFTE